MLSNSEPSPTGASPPGPLTVRAKARRDAVAIRGFIETAIVGGELRPGDRLPTERELVARFGAARNTVRNVLAELAAEGRLIRHVGRGTFVAPQIAAPSPQAASVSGDGSGGLFAGSSPLAVMEVRLLIEPGLADLAVAQASDADLAEIARCLAGAEAAAAWQTFEEWDDALHRAVAAATHNPILIRICGELSAARRSAEWGALKRRSLTAERQAEYQREHRAILAALRERDADAARTAILHHLRHVRANMLGH
jgi:GntR family transcriptional regulator, transcriptional repressor for pyruvate dehydrogenase complex